MNSFYKQMNVLIMCAMLLIAAPVHSMENAAEGIVEQEMPLCPETSVVWYKQSSVQIAAAAITTAAAIYAFAVYQDKVLSPAALCASLFCTQIAQAIVTENQVNNSQDNKSTVGSHDKQNPQLPVINVANAIEPVIVVEFLNENNQQVSTIEPVVVSQDDTQDSYELNKQNNQNEITENQDSTQDDSQQSDQTNQVDDNNGEQDQQTNSTTKEEVVVVTNDVVVELPVVPVVNAPTVKGQVQAFFVRLKDGAIKATTIAKDDVKAWVTSGTH
jgi:hypothetical protein